MPLFERARIEIYLPEMPSAAYHDLLDVLAREFTYTFGGCTIVSGMVGSFLSVTGLPVEDRINLIYTDSHFRFESEFESLSEYADQLREMAFQTLDEEGVLVTTSRIFHSQ